MSTDDVHPNEMNEPHDFDDRATDALLSGGGRDVDPRLADLLGDMRAVYTSTPPAIGAELSALLGATQPTPARPFLSRTFEQVRSSILAKIGVGAVAVVAATGGLAAAGALPARVKDAVSHLGITRPSHHSSDSRSAEDSTTTTIANPADNHGGDVSGVAHDPSSDGCDDGAAVSRVSANDSLRASCDTTTTIADRTAPATPNDSGGDNSDGTPPTTIEPDSTPTTLDNSGADPNSSPVADTNPSGGDTTTSTPAGDN